MPPKAKVTKEDIIKTTFLLTKEHGYESINARRIADALGCSTQPIFRVYKNIAELKSDLFDYINQYFGEYIMKKQTVENSFLSMGLAYIDFAKNERHLFRMLCLSDNLDITDFSELITAEEHGFILDDIPNMNGFNEEKVQELFMNIWLYTHGIATMLSTNHIELSESEIKKLLTNAFKAFTAIAES